MQSRGMYAKKHFGQNFLTDAHVLAKIVAACELEPEDLVLEIGPGLGVLTRELSIRAGRVVAVEIDHEMVEILNETVARENPNVTIVRDDILKADIKGILGDARTIKVCANLPYYITTPVIFGLLEQGLPISQMVVMVQKEVADRFLAPAATKAYGIPTITLAYYGKAELVANVPPHSFHPRPDVHSAVIKITAAAPDPTINPQNFFPLVRAAFANRRKTLVNNLNAHLGLTKEKAHALLVDTGLSPTIRGEALTFEDFANLSRRM